MTVTPESTEVDADSPSSASVQVEAVVPHPLDRVWSVLITRAGTEALLGPGAALGGKGEPWRSDEGPHGVTRSYHPMEQVRLSWHADDLAPASLVELQLQSDGDTTRLELRHDGIAAADRTSLRESWTAALQRVSLATG